MDGEIGGTAQSLEFLSGGGEMGAIFRAFDWSRSQLGAPQDWPQSLRTVVNLMLNSRYPMFLAWGSELSFLYNDAYAPILGKKHPAALGRPFETLWSEIWVDLLPLVTRVLKGESTWSEDLHLVMERNGFPEDTYYTFSYSPVRDESGRIAGVFCACTETTRDVEARRRTQFRLALEEQLRGLSDTCAIVSLVSRHTGENTRASRAGYGEIDEAVTTVSVERDWTDGTTPSLVGEARPLDGFGPAVIAELVAGRTLVVEDCLTDPRCAGENVAEIWESIGTRALIVVPLHRLGRLQAIFFLHASFPRRWSKLDVALAEDATEKTWATLERARAEHRLRESENRFRTMADSAPVLIWMADHDGNCTFLNRSWYDFTGQVPPEGLGSGWLQALHPDDRASTIKAFDDGKAKLSPYQVEYRVRHKDGQYHWMIDAAAPRFDAQGNYLGYTGSIIDNSGRKESEQALRRREHELQVITDAVPMLISQVDANERYHFVNQTYREWFGDRAEGLVGKTIRDIVGDDGYAARIEHIRKALAGDPVSYDGEITLADGRRRAVETRYIPNLQSDGTPDGFFSVVTDITERKQALEERELLTAELQHRIKNVLAVVKALAAQSFKTSHSKEDAADALNARLQALSSAHDLITRTSWTSAQVETVLRAALAPHDANFRRFRLSGPDLTIDAKRALTLALATHELATNALKYGAASNDHGHVDIAWTIDHEESGPIFHWTWQEVDGPVVASPERQGFGTRLIKRVLAADFKGSVVLNYAAEGVRCELRAPWHEP